MNISLKGEGFAFSFTTPEDDETQIEQFLPPIIPLTPAIQAAIDAKYGTMDERKARKAKFDKPENKMEKLLDRIADLEAKVKALETK